MTFARRLLALLCVLAVVFFAAEAMAKSKKGKKGKKKKDVQMDDRKLGGHKYLRPLMFPLAIPTTNVGVGLGYAYFTAQMDEELDLIVLKEDSFTSAGLNEVLDFEISFLKRFSFEMMLEGRALVGADENSALVYGGRGMYMAKAIPKVMAFQKEKWGTCLSFSTDLIWDQGVWSSPAVLMVQMLQNVEDLLVKIENTGQISQNDLEDVAKVKLKEAMVVETTFGVRPSLLFAQTFHPVFGVQVGIRYHYGITQNVDAPELMEWEEGDPPTAILIGTAATFDLNPISKAHLGFKLEADYEMEQDDGEDWTTLTLGGGVTYTGRKNLELGATFYREAGEGEDMTETDYFLILNMRYFF